MAEKAKQKQTRVVRTSTELLKPENLIVSDIRILSTDRSPKDVKNWRDAHKIAESSSFPNRTRLYDLYSDVELDGHLTGIMAKRFASCVNKKLVYKDSSGKKIDAMDPLIRSMKFRELRKRIMLPQAQGLMGVEFVPGEKLDFVDIPRKHIKPEFGVIAKEQSDYTGYEYSKLPLVWVIDTKDFGFLLKCSFYALLKKGNFSDWAQYIEIFGQPVRVIKYDAYDNKTKTELRQVLDESGSSLALMIPNQAEFEIMDGKGANGDGQLQERFKEACNAEMSVIVLGATETTTSSTSSGYAQSKEHAKQQKEILVDDMEYHIGWLNDEKLQAILKSYNWPLVEGGMFDFEHELDLDMLKAKMTIDKGVAEKVPVADDYWYETYGVPKPDNYDELKAKMDEERQQKLNPPVPPAPGKPKPAVKSKLAASIDSLKASLDRFFA